MGINCSFNIKTKDITDIIGKDTIKGLTDAECSSIVTILSTDLGLTQDQVLDKKYRDTIIDTIKWQRKIAQKLKEQLLEKFNISSTIKKNERADYEEHGLQIDNKSAKEESSKKDKKKNKNTLKENLESAKAERPVFDTLEVGKIQQKVLSITFPNVAERIAATEFISNYFSLVLDDVVNGFREDLEENEEAYREALGDEEYERRYNGLHQGTESAQRLFCLSLKQGKTPLPIVIFNKVKEVIDNFKNAGEQDIDKLIYGYYLNEDGSINYKDSYLGKEFWYEAQQNGWNTPKKYKEMATKRVRALMSYCYSKFQSDKVFDALVKEATFSLEFNEGIRLDTRGNVTENNEAKEDRIEDLETELENPNKEGYMIKYKLINPIDTISERLKKELSSIYRVTTTRDGSTAFTFNSWGIRTKLNPMVAYYTLLNEFQSISSEDELDGMFENAANRYPWMESIKDKVVFNPENPGAFSLDFRREFFRSCKSFCQFSMIDSKGKLVPLNRDNQAKTFLDAINKSYEGHEIYGNNPIWNADGTTNMINVEKLRNLIKQPVSKKKSKEELKKLQDRKSKESAEERHSRKEKEKEEATKELEKHPLFLAKRDLCANKENIDNTKDAIKIERAIQILRGEHPKYPRVSLEAILNNIGVNTNDMDLLTMLPVINAFAYDEDGNLINEYDEPISELDIADKNFNLAFSEEFVQWAEDSDMTPMEAFNSIITTKTRRALTSILEAVDLMVSSYSGIGHGGTINENIVQSYQNQYLKIGNALKMANEGYSETSFRFAGNSRYSYIAYDFITRMSNLLTKTDTKEAWDRGTKYIDDNYGQYDFFRMQNKKDSTKGEWYNTWAQQLHDIEEIRREFKISNPLGFGGNQENNTFGKIDQRILIDNMVLAYFNGNQTSNYAFGYYRSPLFSDVANTVLIKGVRYTASAHNNEYYDANDTEHKHPLTWKQIIIRNLSKVLRQEVDRISDLIDSADTDTKIEFYNIGKKNGFKFNFFPSLNAKGKYTSVLDTYNNMRKNLNPVEFKEQSTKFLESLILDIVEGEINPLTGEREGGKLQEFLSQFDSSRLKTIGRKIEVATFQRKEETTEKSDDKLEAIWDDEESKESKESKKEKEEANKQQTIAALTEFFYNDYFAQSQIIQLFGGDLAYYKNFRNFIKRSKQAYASGDRIYGMLMDEQGNNIEPLVERSLYVEDKFMASNSYDNIKNLLSSNVGISDITRDMILGALEAYKSICTTDGQSFRSPKGMKKILQAMGGKWTDSTEHSFNRLMKGKFNTEDFYTIWNNIKPFVFSHETVNVGNRTEKVVTQHKNSEYMMSAFFSLIGASLSQSPQLRALHEFMEENDIDVIHFHSVVKEGYFNNINLNYDNEKFNSLKDENGDIEIAGHKVNADTYEKYQDNLMKLLDNGDITQEEYNEGISQVDFSYDDDGYFSAYNQLYNSLVTAVDENGNEMLNEAMVHKIPLSDYMIVQPSGDHLTDDDLMALFGSQLRNILPADLPSDFSTEITLNGQKRTLNRDEYVKFYNTLIVDQLLDSFNMVSDQFGTIKKLQSALLNKIHGNPKYGPDVEDALQLNEEGTGFRIPFNNPNLNNKIEELILSVFKNSIQKQKINGGNIILVSNFGLSDKLHIQWKKDKNGNEYIDYIPCYMPAYKKSLIQDLLVEKKDSKTGEPYWQVDYNKIKGNEDLLRMIGYRIPTENKYSIFNLRIEGFLPNSAGTAMILPSDTITMSSTDFDKHQC